MMPKNPNFNVNYMISFVSRNTFNGSHAPDLAVKRRHKNVETFFLFLPIHNEQQKSNIQFVKIETFPLVVGNEFIEGQRI